MLLYQVDDKKLYDKKIQDIETKRWPWWLGLIARPEGKKDK